MSKPVASPNINLPCSAIRRMSAGALIALFGLGLTACSTTSIPGRPPAPVAQPTGPVFTPPPQVNAREGLTPPFMQNRPVTRVGILLPFQSRADLALAMFQGAELAVFEQGNTDTLLIPRDSGATEESAEEATRLLLRSGADVILGPLQREQVRAAHRVANGRAPVIGFSNDETIAGNGAYLLSIPPEEEVARIVDFAVRRNLRTFALLAPSSELGRRVEAAFRREVTERGGTVAIVQTYATSTERDASAAARQLAERARTTPVQAVLIPESGAALRAIGPALLMGGMNLNTTRLLGTGAWSTGDALREPTLAGGWYVGPDPAIRSEFEQRYRAAYGQGPSRLASLAYDAVGLAADVTRNRGPEGLQRGAIERENGFVGADGLYRFRSNGTIQRALAVLEVRQTGAVAIEAAPRRFPAPGF